MKMLSKKDGDDTEGTQSDSLPTQVSPRNDRPAARISFDGKSIPTIVRHILDGEPADSGLIQSLDYLSLSEITFEWGDSYDAKDWRRLRAILAPTLMIDYTDVNGHKWDDMTAEEFVGIMSHVGFVGDPLVHTQHHIGASKWQKVSQEEAIGYHQLRAAHQRYTAPDRRLVENKGYGHAMIKHSYRRIDGEWKLSGLRPTIRWNEFDAERIFRGFEAR
ncbi:MAG: hypothetical protein Q9220_000497 [cf. Caloplaca sp. 1 TL-2023]